MNKPIVLTMLNDEDYQLRFGFVNANFIIYDCVGAKTPTTPLPDNHIIVKDITPNIRPDLIISQSKMYHYRILKELADKYKKPIISIYGGLPSKNDVAFAKRLPSSADVFLSLDQSIAWGMKKSTIIPPCPLQEYPKTKKVELYMNKSLEFGSFYKVLAAMARGACVITPAIYEINNILTQSYNGFMYDPKDTNGEKKILSKLIGNDDLLLEIGANAQKTIKDKFSIKSFTENWNKLINTGLENENSNK